MQDRDWDIMLSFPLKTFLVIFAGNSQIYHCYNDGTPNATMLIMPLRKTWRLNNDMMLCMRGCIKHNIFWKSLHGEDKHLLLINNYWRRRENGNYFLSYSLLWQLQTVLRDEYLIAFRWKVNWHIFFCSKLWKIKIDTRCQRTRFD